VSLLLAVNSKDWYLLDCLEWNFHFTLHINQWGRCSCQLLFPLHLQILNVTAVFFFQILFLVHRFTDHLIKFDSMGFTHFTVFKQDILFRFTLFFVELFTKVSCLARNL